MRISVATTMLALAVVLSAEAELRITEICPKLSAFDANNLESGWIELYNDSTTETLDLANYEIVRKNLGKELKAGKKKANLASRSLGPGEYTLVYTSDEYPNSEDLGGDALVHTYDDYGGIMVYPEKVNPKKFPLVALYKGTDASTKELLQIEFIPVDLPPDYSYCSRKIMPTTTPGATNDYTDAIDYGPNIGPLQGIKHSASVFTPPTRPRTNEDYVVTVAANPLPLWKVDSSGAAYAVTNAISSVTLLYHSGFDATNETALAMTATNYDATAQGQLWTATIPASDIPAAGQMLRWRFRISEKTSKRKSTKWTSPSFNNPDDGFQYLGSVVEDETLDDEKLQTFHIFADGYNLTQMDVDVDYQDKTLVPYNARCEIFDAQTGHFYDNVRIDLRGNTSGGFVKKSHGLKFAKCHELVCTNPFDGATIETRKTSFIAEYCDPAYIRQSLAFWTFRQAGCLVPFDYPVRLNLNGEFYQLAFHSARFSDKLIEDYYELDKKGYGYKNSGTLHWLNGAIVNWVACEKKTPDDGDETSSAAMAPLNSWVQYFNAGMSTNTDDQAAVTKKVVETFDVPAWLNYLAEARITMECDDSWANLSTYWDKNGTGLWIPLGYDMNQSWGHIYYWQWQGKKSVSYAAEDRHKAHPFFGGCRVLCYRADGKHPHDDVENWAFEAIWQSKKFRRLYLRRLRTLMDSQLMPPGTAQEDTPFWRDYVVPVTNATWECAKLDYAKWRADKNNLPDGASGVFWTDTGTYCWTGKVEHAQGIADLWNDYVVPRRTHLYVTHAAAGHARSKIGYGENLCAGIPASQSSIDELKANITAEISSDGVVTIRNANDEAVDVSGWQLGGALTLTLPQGCVLDSDDGEVIAVSNRMAFVEENYSALSDEIIVGNGVWSNRQYVTLADADGTQILNTANVEITSLTETKSYGALEITLDLSTIFSAYETETSGEFTATVTIDGQSASASATAAAPCVSLKIPHSSTNLFCDIEISVADVYSATVPEISSTWRYWFDAVESVGGAWTGGEGLTMDDPAVFAVSSPDESSGRVLALDITRRWDSSDDDEDDSMPVNTQISLNYNNDTFKTWSVDDNDWIVLSPFDSDGEEMDFTSGQTATLREEIDYRLKRVRFRLFTADGAVATLRSADGTEYFPLPADAQKLSSLAVVGKLDFTALNCRLLSRDGSEFVGFLIRIK